MYSICNLEIFLFIINFKMFCMIYRELLLWLTNCTFIDCAPMWPRQFSLLLVHWSNFKWKVLMIVYHSLKDDKTHFYVSSLLEVNCYFYSEVFSWSRRQTDWQRERNTKFRHIQKTNEQSNSKSGCWKTGCLKKLFLWNIASGQCIQSGDVTEPQHSQNMTQPHHCGQRYWILDLFSSKQGQYICTEHFIHKGNWKCFTQCIRNIKKKNRIKTKWKFKQYKHF